MLNNGSLPQRMQFQQPVEEPPTIEGLQKANTRLQQYLELFRQQRDNAVIMITNLQADLALANHQIKELEDQIAKVPEIAKSTGYTFEESTPN